MMAHSHPTIQYSSNISHHISIHRCRNIPSSVHLHRRNINIPSGQTKPMASFSSASPDLLQAAKHTVDNYLQSGMVVGLGSGLASSLAIQLIGCRIRDGSLKRILGIPTSLASAAEAEKAGIRLDKYQDSLQIDLAFDDADAIEEGTLAVVIGRRQTVEGDESLIQVKSIMRRAGNLVFMVNEKKYTEQLDGSIPVLVKTSNWMETAEQIDDLFIGEAEVWRRPTYGHADPLGGNYPLVTSEGHHVLDVIFTSPITDLAQVAKSLDEIDGVVDHGVISGIHCTAIIASMTGVEIVDNLSKVNS